MVIALIIALPVSIVLTGFLVLKSVQMGLKWNVQLAKGEDPAKVEIPNPVKSVVEPIKEANIQRQAAEQAEIFEEWLNGPKEK